MSPLQLIKNWQSAATLLRITGGVKGLGFDSLCRIKLLSSTHLMLEWDEGDCSIVLEDAIYEYHELAELEPERRIDEEDEWIRQVIIRWPATPEKLCILFEQRDPS